MFNRQNMINSLDEFLELYQSRPIKDNGGGIGIVHAFYLWYTCKKLNPDAVIESGTWKGQSAWLIEIACPKALVVSIDPDLNLREYISNKIKYTTIDFNLINWGEFDADKVLCFFDDHYGFDRIKQAHHFGFKHILYEDNYHDGRGNVFHPLYGNIANTEPLTVGHRSYSPKAVQRLKTSDYSWFQKHIDVYYEFPPIFSIVNSPRGYEWAKISKSEYLEITPEPLLVEQTPKYKEYYEDYDYTWIAYIKLKEKSCTSSG